jgi:hypothetical protein
MVQAKDFDGTLIPSDELSCQWRFNPPAQQNEPVPNGDCAITYEFPEGLSSQLVNVTVLGKESGKASGMSTRSIKFTAQEN